MLKLSAAYPVASVSEQKIAAQPGEILKVAPEGVTIACGNGALCVTQWQKPGGKRLPAREFLSGFTLREGQRFTIIDKSEHTLT
jgi:methionyl-tRNA formyltransferase